MTTFRCPACQGEYEDPQPSGAYRHICPPLSVPEAVAAGDLPATVLALVRPPAVEAQLQAWLAAVHLRAGHRDENKPLVCPTCRGTSRVPNPKRDDEDPARVEPRELPCPTCRGSGGVFVTDRVSI